MIITGMPRSGTGFMAQVLKSAGIPCSHEGQFTVSGQPVKMKSFDSSWLAAPYVSSYIEQYQVIHLVREPFDVIASLLQSKFHERTDNGHCKFAIQKLADWHKYETLMEKTVYHYLTWNDMLLRHEHHEHYLRHRVEDDPTALIERLGGTTDDLFDNTTFNTLRSQNERPVVTTIDIPETFAKRFADMREHFGYR